MKTQSRRSSNIKQEKTQQDTVKQNIIIAKQRRTLWRIQLQEQTDNFTAETSPLIISKRRHQLIKQLKPSTQYQ